MIDDKGSCLIPRVRMYGKTVLRVDFWPFDGHVCPVDLFGQDIELESCFRFLQTSGMDIAATGIRKANMREV